VHAGQLPAWRARRIAQHTLTLTLQAAAWVDRQIAGVAHRIGHARLLHLIGEAILRFDPARADHERQRAADGRRVLIGDPDPHGIATVWADLDAHDAQHLDATLNHGAAALAALGDTDSPPRAAGEGVGDPGRPAGRPRPAHRPHPRDQTGSGALRPPRRGRAGRGPAVQEAFVTAVLKHRELGDVSNPEAWLRMVALNRLRSGWRHSAVVKKYQAAVPGPQTDSSLISDHVAIVTALSRLDLGQRQVVVLHHLADLGTAEIAAELGIPEGTVKSRLSRGRSRLAELLDESEEPRHA